MLPPPAPRRPRTAASKIVSRAEASGLRQEWRAAGRRVVFTNGCFDLLHAGHVSYLEAARKLGDALVIGLNSDASVRRVKGSSRPIVPERERAEVLGALACVDAVTFFDEETPLAIVTELLPDVLVKGADWAADAIVGSEIVTQAGGQVVRVPLVAGRSTTAIIAAVQAGRTLGPGE